MAFNFTIRMADYNKIQDTAAFIKQYISTPPSIGIILGSGLGALTEEVEKETELSYNDIPGFPVSTVEGHAGKMVFGKLGGKQVMLMAGRFHYYEGYNMQEVTFPVRVMKALGATTLVLSNAAGGMNPSFKVGDIMVIDDHINLFPEHPLCGKNDDRLGTRFPDMSEPYDHKLIELAMQAGKELDLDLKKGTYIGLSGPTFETPAEYKWLHIIGGDAVGMSTVPEAIVAKHGHMRVFALSVITDLGVIGQVHKVSHAEVLAAAAAAEPKVAALVNALVAKM